MRRLMAIALRPAEECLPGFANPRGLIRADLFLKRKVHRQMQKRVLMA
jgi:hypothetical protein